MFKRDGIFDGKPHVLGGTPLVVKPFDTPVEVEEWEYLLCDQAIKSNEIHEYYGTILGILDEIFHRYKCKVTDGEAWFTDYVVCKRAVLDPNKYHITGTVKEVFNIIQSKHGCKVEYIDRATAVAKLKLGGKINAHFDLGKDHSPFIEVVWPGSSCGNCIFLNKKEGKHHCGNKLFTKWNGTSELPDNIHSICSDWYLPNPKIMKFLDSFKFKKKGEIVGKSPTMLYGGEISSALNYDQLTLAKSLLGKVSPSHIWSETGWIFNHIDSKWRFEIPDLNSSLKINVQELVDNYLKDKYIYKLGEVLDHPNFYYHYIDGKEIIFGVQNKPEQEKIVLSESYTNHFDKNKYVILLTINFDKYEIIRSNNEGVQRVLEQSKRIIIHELQHFLQVRHDFGTAIGIEEITRRIERSISQTWRNARLLEDGDEKNNLILKAKEFERNKNGIAYISYREQSAELEAWDVYDRVNFTDQERSSIPPYPINIPKFINGGALNKSSIYERPDMENPVYKVTINGIDKFIQRAEGMNPSDTAWYEVYKEPKHGIWKTVGEHDQQIFDNIGYSRKEAIETLFKKYSVMEEGGGLENSNTTKDEIRDVLYGVSKVVNGAAIQAATSYLRRSQSSSSEAKGSQYIKEQEELIISPSFDAIDLKLKLKDGGSFKRVKPDPNSPEILERWKKKKEHIEQISSAIRGLRNKVTRDLKSKDERTRLTAAVVGVMDETAERVGNSCSASNGHFGVTCFLKKHVCFLDNIVRLTYTGKSGVEHAKQFSDELLSSVLRQAIKDSPSKFVFTTSDGFQINADRVNRYLSEYGISAKDIRGYHANSYVIKRLQKQEIPESDKKRKTAFNKAVKYAAGKVGHGAGTLRNHYLMPELGNEYITNGKIIDLCNFFDQGKCEVEIKKAVKIASSGNNHSGGDIVPDPVILEATGALLIARDTGRVLLLLRSAYEDEKATWCTVGGKIEKGETVLEALYREMMEEIRFNNADLHASYINRGDKLTFYNYIGYVDTEFIPVLNDEHTDFGWFRLSELPVPLHFGVDLLLQHIDVSFYIEQNTSVGKVDKKTDLTPVLDVLYKDHHNTYDFCENCLRSIDNTEDHLVYNLSGKILELWEEEMKEHFKEEEENLFPSIVDTNPETDHKVSEFLMEHTELKNLISKIRKDRHNKQLIAKFVDALMWHIQSEEKVFSSFMKDPYLGNHDEIAIGGKADNLTLKKIADIHHVPLKKIEDQFKKGIKIEQEHTNNIELAKEISKDHLVEFPDYYTRLEKAGL